MNRIEFSASIKQHREGKNISKYKASKDSGLTEIQIGRIDNAVNSYSIDNMFLYLKAIGACIVLSSPVFPNVFKLTSRQDFVKTFKHIRQLNQLSQNKAAYQIGVNAAIITGIESRNVDTSVDKFLLCVQGLKYELKIESL